MQLQELMNQISNKNAPENVKGWERAASAVTGLMMVKRGLRGRGLTSLVLLATGGMALMRAASGRCEIKRKLEESQHGGSHGFGKERYSHMSMDSEPHSPDFKSTSTSLPGSTQMGNEAAAARGAAAASSTGSQGGSVASGTSDKPHTAGSSSPLGSSGSATSGAGSSTTSSSPGSAAGASTSGSSGNSDSSITSGASAKTGSASTPGNSQNR